MLEQILLILDLHPYSDFEDVVISFHGIGESSLMPEKIISVAKSMREIIPDCAINIATTGANPNAFKLWKEAGIKWTHLQVSATDDSVNNLNKMEQLVQMFDEEKMLNYFSQIKFSYVLIKDLNDKEEHLARLISIFSGKDYIIKLSKLNNPSNKNQIESSSSEKFEYFITELAKNNVKNYRFGPLIDSEISCGQLVYLNNNQKEC
jgi:adenine C2-methylase RlmN of 23S rRNA A2503 and tRNA A37